MTPKDGLEVDISMYVTCYVFYHTMTDSSLEV
jgi:hypothetical protein